MAFVKLDTDMLTSTLWMDREAREVFITALLMAQPYEIDEDQPELAIRSLDHTGWKVPAGKYGFVRAAGVGIIRNSGLETNEGMLALERLAGPDPESRSRDFEGRRLVRIDGGFIALNYWKFREMDHTAAARQRRYRKRKKDRQAAPDKAKGNGVTSRGDAVTPRDITHAEAEAEVDTQTSARVEAGTANDWLRYFGTIWAEKRDQLHYGHSGDAKACGSLALVFEAWPAEQRADAWGQRERIVRAYMAETEDRVVKAGHIFAFFVPRFTALYAKPAKKRAFNKPPDIGPRPAPWPGKEQTGG